MKKMTSFLLLFFLINVILIKTDDIIPKTCSPGSVAIDFPYCNKSLSFEERAKDLASRLNNTQKV